MKFSILVLSSPGASQSGDSALAFARAVVEAGHELYRVFFYHEGVQHGDSLAVPAQDELDRQSAWAALSEQHGADLVLCIASAVRRGVLDGGEAERHERSAVSAHPAFELSGLGQLVDAHINSDRLVTFGR
ncbi:MAG: sulfurtransferase complex subunit TusD [Halieaceae bacterium]|nr:sulfurtransferase complex subunit TusD [Halieaceae bacterium]